MLGFLARSTCSSPVGKTASLGGGGLDLCDPIYYYISVIKMMVVSPRASMPSRLTRK